MLSTPRVRRLHRLLGVVIGLQVLLWTASGIYFAWTDIDEIRGDHLKARPAPVGFDQAWVAPTEIDFGAASIDRPVRSVPPVRENTPRAARWTSGRPPRGRIADAGDPGRRAGITRSPIDWAPGRAPLRGAPAEPER